MNRDELRQHLGALLKGGVFDADYAIVIAFDAGFKEADATFKQREQDRIMALQMQNAAKR